MKQRRSAKSRSRKKGGPAHHGKKRRPAGRQGPDTIILEIGSSYYIGEKDLQPVEGGEDLVEQALQYSEKKAS